MFEVQIAQLLVDAELVITAPGVMEISRDRFGALQAGQADTDHAETVVNQLTIGARERRDRFQRLAGIAADELAIQHGKERVQRRVVMTLLEQ